MAPGVAAPQESELLGLASSSSPGPVAKVSPVQAVTPHCALQDFHKTQGNPGNAGNLLSGPVLSS